MRWTNRAALAFVAVVMLAAPARPQEFADVWPGLLTRIERAYVHGDAAEMIAARTTLQELLDADLSDAQLSLARYTVAYLNWRLFTLPDAVPADERGDLLDEAVALLPRTLRTTTGTRNLTRSWRACTGCR